MNGGRIVVGSRTTRRQLGRLTLVLPLLLLLSQCGPQQRTFRTTRVPADDGEIGGSGNGSGATITVGDACADSGLTVCAGPSQKQRFVCEDGVYREDTPCSASENCDPISGNCAPIVSGVNDDTCTDGCMAASCGDGILQPGEDCDDHNAIDNDACSNHCKRPTCGDGIVQAGEACDDGNTTNGDACSTSCTVPGCGDGITQAPNEECDDGNMVNTDACTVACKKPKCGDSFSQLGEECDDGNTTNEDGCTNACRLAKCGDGFTQRPREECEDKNTVDTDLCRNGCKNAASLNSLNGDCQNTDQITQTVCMVAVSNWCKQFNNTAVSGTVTGQSADNEYTVGCINGLQRYEVSTSLLENACGSGVQQSPACREKTTAACATLGAYKIGFYLGSGSTGSATALACGAGTKTNTESVPNCNGIADSSPVPVACVKALADKCGSGKAGLIQARAQANQASYTCVDLNLTGTAHLK